MRHIIPISGKDSLATALVQMQRDPYLDYEYLFNPTGKELPETIEGLKRVETYLGKPILFIGRDMRQIPEYLSGYRPSHHARYCTRKCKIEPMEDHYEGEATIYYGLRHDEPERIGYIAKGKSELKPVYPLREIGFKIDDVIKLCEDANLTPPLFRWELLVAEFTRRLGVVYINETFSKWQLDALFSWRSRNNCYDCYYMRKYEWVGLGVHHPDIFWSVVEEEETLGTRDHPFYVISGLPLRVLWQKRDEIMERYIDKTVSRIRKMMQLKLFDKNELFEDILSTTSCGLLCGK